MTNSKLNVASIFKHSDQLEQIRTKNPKTINWEGIFKEGVYYILTLYKSAYNSAQCGF
jgi:hypothetical protein